ncbi:MAG TPA: glycosyltransferase family 4 protein [Kofleriaceae bacterium]|nr:glycosyltransferase family 4 protein [Kofleriaceae bacterium]
MASQRPQRIGVITTSYPMSDADPAGGFVAAHTSLLRAAGNTVEIVAAASSQPAGALAAPAATHRIGSAAVFAHGGAPDALETAVVSHPWLQSGLFSLRMAAVVARRRHHWDAVVAHWLAPSALAALTTRGPLLAIAHGGDVHLLHRLHLLTPTVAALAARRARLVFVNRTAAALVKDAVPVRLARYLDQAATVIPMGVAVDNFATVAQRRLARPTPSVPRVVVIARHVTVKGIDVMLAALPWLPIAIELQLVGNGPLTGKLQHLAANLRAQHPRHTIEFVGALAPAQRDEALAQADLVVVPSRQLANGRTEGMPQVALEALASGIPLVATATGGLADLPPPVVLCAPDSPQALANAIIHTLAAPPAAIDCMAVAAEFSWPRVYQRLRDHWFAGP